ncbi:TPA: hypothetical protein DEP21_03030 [Patescibacteria group bacterium]|nr:hypothetical protein [Candidatus Gracilibacteria bacterium]
MKAFVFLLMLASCLSLCSGQTTKRDPFLDQAIKNLGNGYFVVGCIIDTTTNIQTDLPYVKKLIIENSQNVFFFISLPYKDLDEISCAFVGISDKKTCIKEYILTEKHLVFDKIIKKTNPKRFSKLGNDSMACLD